MHEPIRGGGPSSAGGARKLAIQIGVTVSVVVIAVVLVLYLLISGREKLSAGNAVASPTAGQSESIRVSSDALVTKPGSTEPKVVLSLYEDLLCPHCARFEQAYGPTIDELIASGTVAVDYYLIAILDSPRNQNYSSRAAAAAYCVADYSVEAFRGFHAALLAAQPDEFARDFPTDDDLAETAEEAGAGGDVADCILSGRYVEMTKGLAADTDVQSTPTVRINGEDYDLSTPEDLVRKVTRLANR